MLRLCLLPFSEIITFRCRTRTFDAFWHFGFPYQYSFNLKVVSLHQVFSKLNFAVVCLFSDCLPFWFRISFVHKGNFCIHLTQCHMSKDCLKTWTRIDSWMFQQRLAELSTMHAVYALFYDLCSPVAKQCVGARSTIQDLKSIEALGLKTWLHISHNGAITNLILLVCV